MDRINTMLKLCACAMLLAAAAMLGGCGQGTIIEQTGVSPLPAGEGSPAFIDRMSSRQTVSEDDAMRGILMLMDGKDDCKTFRQRAELLRDRGVADASWDNVQARCVTKCRLAYMIYQACKIQGGVVLSVAGPSQRYCLRELQYQGFISQGPPLSLVSGSEFVAVLARADVYVQTGHLPEVMLSQGAN